MGNESSVLTEAHNDIEFFEETAIIEESPTTIPKELFYQKKKFTQENSISQFLVINSRLIITGSFENLISVWNTEEKFVEKFSNHKDERITCLEKINENKIVSRFENIVYF